MHLYFNNDFDDEVIFQYHFPFFFLDGNGNNYSHECEYRFILCNHSEIEDVAADLLTEGSVRDTGTMREYFLQRRSSSKTKELLVPINMDDYCLEVVFGKHMPKEQKEYFLELSSKTGHSIQFTNSNL